MKTRRVLCEVREKPSTVFSDELHASKASNPYLFLRAVGSSKYVPRKSQRRYSNPQAPYAI
jgi:hypothetical protein